MLFNMYINLFFFKIFRCLLNGNANHEDQLKMIGYRWGVNPIIDVVDRYNRYSMDEIDR